MRNSDSGKGKSGGCRIIYQRTTEGAIALITIYSKTEQEDIAPADIRQIILDYETQRQSTDSANGEVAPPETGANGATVE